MESVIRPRTSTYPLNIKDFLSFDSNLSFYLQHLMFLYFVTCPVKKKMNRSFYWLCFLMFFSLQATMSFHSIFKSCPSPWYWPKLLGNFIDPSSERSSKWLSLVSQDCMHSRVVCETCDRSISLKLLLSLLCNHSTPLCSCNNIPSIELSIW